MNRTLLDILACPMDKHHPLELYSEDTSNTIQSGALYCTQCGRFYIILDGIPVMLPDELRNRRDELEALSRMPKLPDKILHHGKPWNLSES